MASVLKAATLVGLLGLIWLASHIRSSYGEALAEVYVPTDQYPVAVYDAVDRRFTPFQKRQNASHYIQFLSLHAGRTSGMEPLDGLVLHFILLTASDDQLSLHFLRYQYKTAATGQDFTGFRDIVLGVCGRDVETLNAVELDGLLKVLFSGPKEFCAPLNATGHAD